MSDLPFLALGPALAEAVAVAYEVFGDHEIKAPLGYCSCEVCITPERERELAGTRASALTEGDMYRLSSSVEVAVPEANDKALLPRIFELLGRGDSASGGPCQLFPLQRRDWRGWPAPEVAAILGFCQALLAVALEPGEEAERLETQMVLTTLAHLGVDWLPYLTGAVESGDPERLRCLLRVAPSMWNGHVRPNGDWDGVPEVCQALEQLLLAPATLEALERVVLEGSAAPESLADLNALHAWLDDGAPQSLEIHRLMREGC